MHDLDVGVRAVQVSTELGEEANGLGWQIANQGIGSDVRGGVDGEREGSEVERVGSGDDNVPGSDLGDRAVAMNEVEVEVLVATLVVEADFEVLLLEVV